MSIPLHERLRAEVNNTSMRNWPEMMHEAADALEQRDALYREIADLVVETDGRKVKAVANDIIEQM